GCCVHVSVRDWYKGTMSRTIRNSLGSSAWACTRSSWRLLRGALELSVMRYLSLAYVLSNHVSRAKLARQLAVRSTAALPRAKLPRQLAVRSTAAPQH